MRFNEFECRKCGIKQLVKKESELGSSDYVEIIYLEKCLFCEYATNEELKNGN